MSRVRGQSNRRFIWHYFPEYLHYTLPNNAESGSANLRPIRDCNYIGAAKCGGSIWVDFLHKARRWSIQNQVSFRCTPFCPHGLTTRLDAGHKLYHKYELHCMLPSFNDERSLNDSMLASLGYITSLVKIECQIADKSTKRTDVRPSNYE